MTIPDLGEDITESNPLPDAHFKPTKAKPHRPQNSFSPQQRQETADELNSLYSCPEEGCIKAYQRFSALQHHLDCGRHERALEHETLLDKAVHGYSERLQGQSGSFVFTRHLVCLFYWANLPRGKEHEQDSGPLRGAPPYPIQKDQRDRPER